VNDRRPSRDENGLTLHWMARGLSITTSGLFLLILGLAIANEDKPRGPAVPVLVLLGLTLMASVAAWRWERVGGLVVILLAGALAVAAYSASQAFALGSTTFLPALLYGGPFLAVGILFWLSGRIAASDSRRDGLNRSGGGS
jgi:xanthine/uracil/vitamin C permease (AzgA family)